MGPHAHPLTPPDLNGTALSTHYPGAGEGPSSPALPAPPALLRWAGEARVPTPCPLSGSPGSRPPSALQGEGLSGQVHRLSSQQPQLCAPGRSGSPARSPGLFSGREGEDVGWDGSQEPILAHKHAVLSVSRAARSETGQSGGPNVSQEVVGKFSV